MAKINLSDKVIIFVYEQFGDDETPNPFYSHTPLKTLEKAKSLAEDGQYIAWLDPESGYHEPIKLLDHTGKFVQWINPGNLEILKRMYPEPDVKRAE